MTDSQKNLNLQKDYFRYLFGHFSSGIVKIEESNIAGGRADITVTVNECRFVTEVKRESDDASFDNLFKKFGGQATEYQITNIRLGILLVLDLTDKPDGIQHAIEQVQAYAVERLGEKSKRGLVIVRIPGNRLCPSGGTGSVEWDTAMRPSEA